MNVIMLERKKKVNISWWCHQIIDIAFGYAGISEKVHRRSVIFLFIITRGCIKALGISHQRRSILQDEKRLLQQANYATSTRAPSKMHQEMKLCSK
jgi:hypothetical protein